MRPYFRLVRLPNVFTALADIAAGYAIARVSFGAEIRAGWVWLVPASACLYLSGMAFNDFADREEDVVSRPVRPLPAGTVSPITALVVASGLMLAGLFSAFAAGASAVLLAVALCATILAYDFLHGRLGPLGPLILGACRFLNIQLGMASFLGFAQAWATPTAWRFVHAPAAALGLYAAGLTAFSAREESGRGDYALRYGWVLLACAFAFACTVPHPFALLPLVVLYGLLARRSKTLSRQGTPAAAKALVLDGVLGICIVDASLALGHAGFGGWPWGYLPALALVPALLLGKLLRAGEA